MPLCRTPVDHGFRGWGASLAGSIQDCCHHPHHEMRVSALHGRGLGASSPHFAAISHVLPFDEIKSVLFGSDGLTMDKMTCWTLCLSKQLGPDDGPGGL